MRPEALLVLKQAAEVSMQNTEKGLKDRIDIMDLLLKCQMDFAEYKNILQKEGLTNFKSRLLQIITVFSELKYLDLNPGEFKLRKGELVDGLKKS